MYAVIESGSKQHIVKAGDIIDVEKLDAAKDSNITINEVLLVSNSEGEVKIGQPKVNGASVLVKVIDHGKADKVVIFRYKNKINYRHTRGHRQPYTRLKIEQINA